jgi:hypothetical protein
MKITKSQLRKIIKEELLKEEAPTQLCPPSYEELVDGLSQVTQALADIIGDGDGPYDHLIVDVDEAVDLIRRAGREW